MDISIAKDLLAWNPVLSLTFNGAGELTRIEETAGGVTVRQDITWTNGCPTTIGAWTKV